MRSDYEKLADVIENALALVPMSDNGAISEALETAKGLARENDLIQKLEAIGFEAEQNFSGQISIDFGLVLEAEDPKVELLQLDRLIAQLGDLRNLLESF